MTINEGTNWWNREHAFRLGPFFFLHLHKCSYCRLSRKIKCPLWQIRSSEKSTNWRTELIVIQKDFDFSMRIGFSPNIATDDFARGWRWRNMGLTQDWFWHLRKDVTELLYFPSIDTSEPLLSEKHLRVWKASACHTRDNSISRRHSWNDPLHDSCGTKTVWFHFSTYLWIHLKTDWTTASVLDYLLSFDSQVHLEWGGTSLL